jgi:pyruvate dehydrogenase E2 component (dihydrolipoamide acetyltransferase)
MANEIVVPRLGWNMEQGVFLGWLKRDGEAVQAGEPLFTLEGDKSAQEVEAVDSGVLRIAPGGPAEGDVVAVGTVLGHLATSVVGQASLLVPAEEEQARMLVLRATRQAVSPRARRVARELGLDARQVRGSGRNGRVRERDVLAHADQSRPSPTPAPSRASHTRRVIAERMLHSQRTTAPVTLTTTADATNLANLRGQFKAVAAEAVPTYTDLLVKLTALALRQHPLLNARWHDEQIVLSAEINIGVAVDTEAGLLVPVVRDVPALTLRQLARQTRALAEKARQRKLTPDDTRGGTFTVTNLGAFGIDAFTPIINWPECAILGVGRVQRRPAVVNDQLVPRDQVTLSLTFDHRLVDGAPASRFLQTLVQGVENPSAWLVE